MTCPGVNRDEAEARLSRARVDVMEALAPLVSAHGADFAVLSTALVLGEMIGMANCHAQLAGSVSEQMRAVHNMMAKGVATATVRIQAPGGRA
jgi:hypothetical protein